MFIAEWNQWEAGIGTGGGKVRAYKTDEYLHGENLHSSDESGDSEHEVPEEKKTMYQRRQDMEKNPGIFPAPEVTHSFLVVRMLCFACFTVSMSVVQHLCSWLFVL